MQIGPRIRFDKHTLGNFVKNVAPAAALIPGVGVLGAGALATLGGLGRGEKLGHALMGGVENAALGGGLASIGGKLGIGTGAHLGLGLGSPIAPTPQVNISSVGGLPAETVASTPGNLAGRAVAGAEKAGGGLLSFAEAHPNAASGALQGLGGIATSGSENRLRNAQASNLEQQAGETAYDFGRRKARDAQLAPLWGALGSDDAFGYGKIPPNPYAPKVG